ncbi:MAG TPA: hypothetical protein VLD86_17600 [Ilumatobacteraceae bacterium]|nr:hypothetical protein [Ilumatobacteraceae bacterium]
MNIPQITKRRVAFLGGIGLIAALAAGQLTAQAHEGHGTNTSLRLTEAQRTVIREATSQYKDVDEAIAAGYLPTDSCAELPGVGGMGYHFINPVLASDAKIDPTQPELLLYTKDAQGRFKLAGAEWFVADADQDLSTDPDRPTLFGHPFDGPMPGHEPGMPMHFDLHAWVYLNNPTGELSAWNPRVTCPAP